MLMGSTIEASGSEHSEVEITNYLIKVVALCIWVLRISTSSREKKI